MKTVIAVLLTIFWTFNANAEDKSVKVFNDNEVMPLTSCLEASKVGVELKVADKYSRRSRYFLVQNGFVYSLYTEMDQETVIVACTRWR